MKIIGSDYDGTLNHNGIDDAKRQAIEDWRQAGNVFALVSGRHVNSVRDLHLEQNFGCDYFVGSNGAVILDANNQVVHADCCDMAMLKPLIQYLYELGCSVGLVHSVDFFDVFPENVDISSLKRDHSPKSYTLDTIPEIPYYTQVSTWRPTLEEAAEVAAKVREKLGAYFNPMQNGLNIDIVRSDVNKAKGLYKLMELVGASYDDVITVGDNVNDYDMIKEFKSYAMDSGVQSIKDLADFTIPGVAELIRRELET